MRQLSTAEMLQLRELMQAETNSLAKAKATHMLIEDDELKVLAKAGIQASEARIKGIQQFISENDVISMEVH